VRIETLTAFILKIGNLGGMSRNLLETFRSCLLPQFSVWSQKKGEFLGELVAFYRERVLRRFFLASPKS
jgi:hypothetical protein